MSIVGIGRFGFCSLIQYGKQQEVECFVAAVDKDTSLILVPIAPLDEFPSGAAGAKSSDTSDWDLAGVGVKRAETVITLPSGSKDGDAGGTLQVLKVRCDGVHAAAQTKG